jgi:lipopolysaccharide transport system permease protein
MLKPLLYLAFALPVLLYGVLGYVGSPIVRKFPFATQQKGNWVILCGWLMVGIALALGMVGYWTSLNATKLLYLRANLGTLGALILIQQAFHLLFSDDDEPAQASLRPKARNLELKRYFELIRVLVVRNLKVRYRGSILGAYWSLMNPLVMTCLYAAVFGTSFSQYYNNSIVSYMLAAFTGLVVINFFSGATTQTLTSVVENSNLMNKIRLPVSVFPVSTILANVIQFSISVLPILVIVTLITSKNIFNVLALALPLLAMTLFSMGIGYIVSTLFVFFRDLKYFYEVVVSLLWISIPVFYPSEIVPPQVKGFLFLNPLVGIVDSLRQISLTGGFPDLSLTVQPLFGGLLVYGLGWVCFRAWKSEFMDLL